MPRRAESPLRRIASLYPRLVLRRISHIERRIRDYSRQTLTRRRLSRAFSVVLFGCMSFVIMGSYGCQSCVDLAIDLGLNPVAAKFFFDYSALLGAFGYNAPHHGASPRLTGTDGSQTGTASFLGNFSAITQPPQNYFVMLRAADCSLNLVTGSSTQNGAGNINAVTTNYERTLHQLASLTTTPDVFPKGCAETSLGITSRVGVAVQRKTNGAYVLATAAGNGNNNGVFILSASPDFSSVKFNVLSGLPAASALATADLNGDGIGDLVIVNDYNAASSYISVAIGNGDGTFQSAVNYPIAGNMSVAAVIDDVNNDGKLDIVAASDDGHLSVLLGNGNGTFSAAQSFSVTTPAGSSPINALITADLNNDGKKDIICSSGLVLLGNGDGTFTPVSAAAFPPTQNLTSSTPLGLASGDLNNDGKADLVVSTGVVVSIYLGKGDGTFTPGPYYPSIAGSGYVTVTDLDGDGNLDIYSGLANSGLYSGDDSSPAAAYVLMGNGDGTFQGAGSVPVGTYIGNNLGDVNGDGQMDLITQNSSSTNVSFTVSLGTPKGSFTPTSTITQPATFVLSGTTFTGPGSVAGYSVADINGDGKADLVFIEYNIPQINPYTNQPQINAGGFYFVALSNGDGTFKTPVPYALPQIAPPSGFDINIAVSSLQIADFNKDGKPDLIYVYDEVGYGTAQPYNRGMAVVLGNGDGTFATSNILTPTFASSTAPTTAVLPQVVNTSDINSDGKPDMLVVSTSFSTSTGAQTGLQAYIGNGDGTFKAPTPLPFTANVYGIPVVADLNKDGKPDVVALMETSGSQAEMGIALGNGDGTFATPTVLNLSGGDVVRGGSLVAADFDGDGKVDLALLDYPGFAYSGVFYGNGNGTFTSVPFNGAVVPKDLLNLYVGGAATAVDLNKDGKPDILVGGTILLNIYGSAPVVTPTQASTTTALGSSPSGSVATGTSVTFTATITPGSTGTPTGTVTFLDGSTVLGTGTLSSNAASFTTSTLAAGSHNITAVYSGDANFTGSTSSAVTVTVAGSLIATTTSLSATATSAVSGTSLTFTAQVSPASGSSIPTGTVTFTDGATSLGIISLDATGKAAYTTSSLAVGSHAIKAAYAGSATLAASTSSNLAVTITAVPPPTPDFSISVTPTTSTVTHGNTTTTTLTITPANGFNLATALTCGGAPSGATCTIAPTSVTPNGSSVSTATVTIQTSATSSSLPNTHRDLALAATLPLGLVGTTALFGLGFSRRRRWSLLLTALITFTALVTVIGCGHSSGSSSTSTFTATTYNITVTGTSGTLVHTAPWTISVQ